MSTPVLQWGHRRQGETVRLPRSFAATAVQQWRVRFFRALGLPRVTACSEFPIQIATTIMSLATVLLGLLAALAPLAVSAQSNWFQLAWAQLPFTGSNPPGRFSSACAWNAVKSQLFCAGGSTGPVGDFNEMRDMWYDPS